MAGDNSSTVKTVNSRLLKIDAVKFYGNNNFKIWRCEVMDVLTTSNLEDTLRLEENLEETSEKY